VVVRGGGVGGGVAFLHDNGSENSSDFCTMKSWCWTVHIGKQGVVWIWSAGLA